MGTRHAAIVLPQPHCRAGQPLTGVSLQSMGLEGDGCWGTRAGAGAAKWYWAPALRQWCQNRTGMVACHLRQVQHVPCSWRGWQCPLSPRCTGCPHAPLVPEEAFPFGKIVTEEAISLKTQAAHRLVAFLQRLLCIYAVTCAI